MSKDDIDFDEIYDGKIPDFTKTLNIVFVGKVSTGKSSLINAVLKCERSNPVAKVGATSGVTTKVKSFQLDDNVLIIDSPGLDDVEKENSKVTQDFLKHIDVGIMVVSGSADATQKNNFNKLKSTVNKVFVVLNKSDEWDDLEDSALSDVLNQWKAVLNVDKIYPTCTKGYDPRLKKDAPMDIRGVDELSDDLWSYLRAEGKDLLLARHLGDKRAYAAGIISTALVAVGAEAFIPGSAAYITATQVVAITALHYLYTGDVLSKSSALGLMPTFIGESLGVNAFLWVKSFLPPTGVVDIAAAGVAITITLAMLSAVTYVLSSGYELNKKEILKEQFGKAKNATGSDVKNEIVSAIKSGGSIKDIVYRLLFSKN